MRQDTSVPIHSSRTGIKESPPLSEHSKRLGGSEKDSEACCVLRTDSCKLYASRLPRRLSFCRVSRPQGLESSTQET